MRDARAPDELRDQRRLADAAPAAHSDSQTASASATALPDGVEELLELVELSLTTNETGRHSC
jgi:hypothetical protein